jgi:hypothetical protein
MKKYLMMALAVVAFASCTKNDVVSMSQAELDKAKYDQAFLRYIGGTIDANQDWGFSTTRSENANANEWADPNKAYGGLLVPPALTAEQIAVVKKYFQTTRNIPYQDPKWTNYFIQQVYKGHTDVPEGCATPEEYTALNGTTKLLASDYMDHLAAIDGDFVDHINNFNHGDCDENDHVLDNGGNANDGPFHTDKIMYMQNSTTKSFGYYNSNGSLCHTKYTGLVSYKTIMSVMGSEADCLEDGWNRSFMGFDFEQMTDDQCYATVAWNDPTPKELTFWGDYYINGVKQTNYVYQYNGQPVKMLSDQTNRYCGTLRTVTDAQLYSEERDADNNNAYLGTKLNTDFIDGLLRDGYLPIDNKQYREWAKVGGCADGYYSDWIVTLTEAKAAPTGDLRIIAEDISATDASDFDFNDVVLDVKYGSPATVKLICAGGTLPLYINVQDEAHEVHNIFATANPDKNIDVTTMINTHATASEGYGAVDGLAEVDITSLLNVSIDNAAEANTKLKLYVLKNGVLQEMTAPKGEPSCKLAVDPSYKILRERQSIKGSYPLFVDWANGTGFVSKWWINE